MKNSYIIAIVVFLAIAAGTTYYFVSRKKKGNGTTTTGNGDGSEVVQPPVVSTATTYTGAQMVALAKRLHTDMEANASVFSYFNQRDDEAWRRLATMTNQYLSGVNAAFNSLYKASSGKSMTTWIKDTGAGGGADEGYTKQAILYRLYDLNLY